MPNPIDGFDQFGGAIGSQYLKDTQHILVHIDRTEKMHNSLNLNNYINHKKLP